MQLMPKCKQCINISTQNTLYSTFNQIRLCQFILIPCFAKQDCITIPVQSEFWASKGHVLTMNRSELYVVFFALDIWGRCAIYPPCTRLYSIASVDGAEASERLACGKPEHSTIAPYIIDSRDQYGRAGLQEPWPILQWSVHPNCCMMHGCILDYF